MSSNSQPIKPVYTDKSPNSSVPSVGIEPTSTA